MKALLSSIAIGLVLTGLAPLAGAAGDKDAAGDRTIGERVDDAKITAAVKAKLVVDRAANLIRVDVDTKEGVVHLQGSVPSEQAKIDAERLARETSGVVAVTNNLRVETRGSDAGRPDAAGSASPGAPSPNR
jgi:osmotically-inducible protein OsmY